MAKKRKEELEETEFDFKLPKFDEEKFLKRERRNIKTLFITFLFGLLITVISLGFWALLEGSGLRWELMLLFGVFNAAWLKYIFLRLNIDLTDFGRVKWLGTYGTYFLTWLIFLLIFVNPPFYDGVPPQITTAVLPEMQETGGTVLIVARITDNVGVNTQGIQFTLIFPDGRNQSPSFTYNNTIFSFTFENSENLMGTYQYSISATDVNRRTTVSEGQFVYDNGTIRLPEPVGSGTPPGPLITYATALTFDVRTNASRVYYTVDDGVEINATREGDFFRSTPEYQGWSKNQNVTVHAFAEIVYYFPYLNQRFTNTIVDSSEYYFQVVSEGIGEEQSPSVALPGYVPIPVPGFEAVFFLVAIGIALILFARRKKRKAV